MLTLSLLRHAKSSWDDPDLDDFERGLAPRGIKAAHAMARYIAKENQNPGLILCSSAVRARATLALMLPELGASPPDVHFDDALYLASPVTMLDALRAAPGEHNHVMLIGHNPGMHALALELTGSGERKALSDLAMRYPTAALALFSFKMSSWEQIGPAQGRLERFITPKSLRD